MSFFKHLNTVNKHRHAVMKHCFKAGIPFQGLCHDLSKYSIAELFTSARYYEGTRSPTERERETVGYSLVWMHHKGRNKHHFEYWVDINPKTKNYEPVEMPVNYIVEMLCDRMAASKIYKGKDYTDSAPYDYFEGGRAKRMMHPESSRLIEELLLTLKNEGEAAVFKKSKALLAESKKKSKKA